MMKLVRIVSHLENQIDEVLVIVPDDFDKFELLDEAREVAGIPEPRIEAVADLIGDESFDEGRFFIG